MNINISIVDQRLLSIMDFLREQASRLLKITDEERLRSLAFVFVCVQTVLDLEEDAAFDCLTEGGGDFGVDAVHISEEFDGEFTVSLFQGKYDRSLEGNKDFPGNGIDKLITSVQYLFDPAAQLKHVNTRLRVKIEEIRSLIRDGYLPRVRVLACSNGLAWKLSAQEAIDRAGFGSQVTWEHVDHNEIVSILQSTKPVNDTIQLSGLAIVEDMYYSRVLVGRIAVREIASLVERHGERLLERNIRRYLGLQGNRVNESIRETLLSEEKSNFYFFNNGITMTCDKLEYNALQKGDYQVRVGNLQIINGGQTCMTIYKTFREGKLTQDDVQAFVLLRLYQLPSDNDELVRRITYANNSQNPVDLRDLRANDSRQQRLEISVKQLGYVYRRKRVETGMRPTDITSGTAAEAVLAVWRQRPHQAKFFAREHFGKLYDIIFTEDLTGAQVIVAVKLYRMAENRRKRPKDTDPSFVSYASCFIAMQMGMRLLKELNMTVTDVTHGNFVHIDAVLAFGEDELFSKSVEDVDYALSVLYGKNDISWQQLSATFRRGDLIDILRNRIGFVVR
jgi:hypothetical protein